jgi:carboxymethylenebutenolidase
MGEMLQFPSNGHTARGYLSIPTVGSGPGVILIQEWWGLVDHIKDVCDRFAREGFVCLAPDLYDGQVPKGPDQAGKLLMALSIARADAYVGGAATALLARAEVTSRRVAVVGFCMGGQLALYAAAEHPDQIGAVVDFYGIHPNVKLDLGRIRVPVLAHFGKHDNSVREADARALVDKLTTAGGSIEAHFYDAGHAFFNDTRPTVFDRNSAAVAWKRTLAFLQTTGVN